jgi:hypothetical protein
VSLIHANIKGWHCLSKTPYNRNQKTRLGNEPTHNHYRKGPHIYPHTKHWTTQKPTYTSQTHKLITIKIKIDNEKHPPRWHQIPNILSPQQKKNG